MVKISEEYISESTKLNKETLKMMVRNNTLPPHLREVFEEAKNWWFHNSTQVLKDNMRIANES